MKKMTSVSLSMFAGMVLQSTAHAAPITYRADSWWQLDETQYSSSGGSVALTSDQYLIAGIKPALSIMFTYDSSVPLTPRAALPSNEHVTYLDAFTASGALTNVAGTLGDWHFTATSSNTNLTSFIPLDVYPGTTVHTNLGMIGPIASEGVAFAGTFGGKVYTLTDMALSFGTFGATDALPSTLHDRSFDTTALLQLQFSAADGDTVTAGFYLPTMVSQVPVPSAAWLLGSGLLGLAGAARRNRK